MMKSDILTRVSDPDIEFIRAPLFCSDSTCTAEDQQRGSAAVYGVCWGACALSGTHQVCALEFDFLIEELLQTAQCFVT